MKPLIYTVVYGKTWHYYGDRLIGSLREAGYDGDIFVIKDVAYSPPDGVSSFALNLDSLDVVDERPEVARIWMSRYYIDRLCQWREYTDFLYFDADCVIMPGQKIDELLQPGNWFVLDKEKWNPDDDWWWEYFGKAMPRELVAEHPDWKGINSGTFKIQREDLGEFCHGVREVFRLHPDVITDQAVLNGYLRCHAKIKWKTWRDFLVGFINAYDYDLAARMRCVVAHELGNIKGDNYQCHLFQ